MPARATRDTPTTSFTSGRLPASPASSTITSRPSPTKSPSELHDATASAPDDLARVQMLGRVGADAVTQAAHGAGDLRPVAAVQEIDRLQLVRHAAKHRRPRGARPTRAPRPPRASGPARPGRPPKKRAQPARYAAHQPLSLCEQRPARAAGSPPSSASASIGAHRPARPPRSPARSARGIAWKWSHEIGAVQRPHAAEIAMQSREPRAASDSPRAPAGSAARARRSRRRRRTRAGSPGRARSTGSRRGGRSRRRAARTSGRAGGRSARRASASAAGDAGADHRRLRPDGEHVRADRGERERPRPRAATMPSSSASRDGAAGDDERRCRRSPRAGGRDPTRGTAAAACRRGRRPRRARRPRGPRAALP